MGRSGIAAGEGMLISPAPAIHTAFMRFPIDALFLDGELKVLRVVERLGPWRVASERNARCVLELPAGESSRCGARRGDRLELRDPRPGSDAVPRDAPVGRSVAVSEQAMRLAPLRVIVLSEDRRFHGVMTLLLSRRNCSVSVTADAVRLCELVEREGADVVVIDLPEREGTISASALRALPRAVGIVVVSDGRDGSPGGEHALAKWGPFAELMAAIERAGARRWNGEAES